MNPLRKTLPLGLAALLLSVTLVLPLAAAQAADETSADQVDCGSILEEGAVFVALCFTNLAIGLGKAAACIAWRLLWGQSAPCPIN